MEFKDLPMPFQEMAANVVRSQLATLDLSTVEKETIDNISGNVRRAFIGLYEEKQLSDNQDLHEKYFLDLMDILDKGFGLLMKKKGIRIEPLENYFATKSINSFDSKKLNLVKSDSSFIKFTFTFSSVSAPSILEKLDSISTLFFSFLLLNLKTIPVTFRPVFK